MATLKLKGFEEAQKLMAKLPEELAGKAARKAMKAAGEILRTAASQSAPRSKVTGTWNTQSKKIQDASPIPLAETIVVKSKTFGSGVSVVMVGPSHPLGNHGYNVEQGHKARFWKRPSTGAVVPGKKWFAPVVDSTQSQQEAAVLSVMQNEAAKIK